MTLPEVIIWAVVVAVGFTFAWKNPTAAALVLSWLVGQALYYATGDNLPVEYYPYIDSVVIAVVAMKTKRSSADWIVLVIFLAMWCAYPFTEQYQYHIWWLLYYLALAQFLAVGWESLPRYRHAEPTNDTLPPSTDGVFRRLVWARGHG